MGHGQGGVTRDISYAGSARSRTGRAVIRAVENATGRLALIRRARGYDREVAAGADFWAVMAARYGLSLQITRGALDHIPASGPLIVVANHPYGILDGLVMGQLLSALRGDFRIIAHGVFRKAAELDRVILPISFEATPEALAANLQTRKDALTYLASGGAVGIFPGGTVSTAPRPFGRPLDPAWRGFAARMIARSDATVVPVFFEGANSRLFQLASHLHQTLRVALLIREFRARVDRPVRLAVGQPIARAEIDARRGDTRAMMDFLRAQTYALSPEPVDAGDLGFEFEERHRR